MLTGTGLCGDGTTALPGLDPSTTHAQGRCGYGPRLPLLVISPYSKVNYVDHTVSDQSSVLAFIEYNWLKNERLSAGSFDNIANPLTSMFDFHATKLNPVLTLDPSTGELK